MFMVQSFLWHTIYTWYIYYIRCLWCSLSCGIQYTHDTFITSDVYGAVFLVAYNIHMIHLLHQIIMVPSFLWHIIYTWYIIVTVVYGAVFLAQYPFYYSITGVKRSSSWKQRINVILAPKYKRSMQHRRLDGWSINWLIDWLIDWLINWLIDFFNDWFI